MNNIVVNGSYGGFALSPLALSWLSERGHELSEHGWDEENDCYFPRHHPALVECVEVLGDEANAESADLGITEIEGNRYIIKEYDGHEIVQTPKTFSWVVIGGEE